jgi:hypothetical protein
MFTHVSRCKNDKIKYVFISTRHCMSVMVAKFVWFYTVLQACTGPFSLFMKKGLKIAHKIGTNHQI